MAPKKSYRRKKRDFAAHHDEGSHSIRVDYAVLPFDRLCREMDRKWGINRLPELVSATTAEKYGSAMTKLNAAIMADDPEEAKVRAEVCARGLQAMDAEATAAGHDPKPDALIEFENNGHRFAIMTDERRWPAYQEQHPDVTLVSLRQVGNALMEQIENNPVVEEMKKQFPSATVTQIKTKTPLELELNDEIPF